MTTFTVYRSAPIALRCLPGRVLIAEDWPSAWLTIAAAKIAVGSLEDLVEAMGGERLEEILEELLERCADAIVECLPACGADRPYGCSLLVERVQ